jgi:hypothetical protein
MIDMSDIIYILFAAICVWLAIHWEDSGGGGGHRSRVRVSSAA